MFARVNQAWVDPENFPDAMEFLKESIVPRSMDQDGFRSVFMLTREDGQVLVVSLYDTAEQIRETETTGWYQHTTEIFEDKIKGQVRRNVYAVTMGKAFETDDRPAVEAAEQPQV